MHEHVGRVRAAVADAVAELVGEVGADVAARGLVAEASHHLVRRRRRRVGQQVQVADRPHAGVGVVEGRGRRVAEHQDPGVLLPGLAHHLAEHPEHVVGHRGGGPVRALDALVLGVGGGQPARGHRLEEQAREAVGVAAWPRHGGLGQQPVEPLVGQRLLGGDVHRPRDAGGGHQREQVLVGGVRRGRGGHGRLTTGPRGRGRRGGAARPGRRTAACSARRWRPGRTRSGRSGAARSRRVRGPGR